MSAALSYIYTVPTSRIYTLSHSQIDKPGKNNPLTIIKMTKPIKVTPSKRFDGVIKEKIVFKIIKIHNNLDFIRSEYYFMYVGVALS